MVTKLIGYDLSDQIEMITTWYDLDGSERYVVFEDDKQLFVRYLNHYGPMYRFITKKGDYLVQNQEDQIWFIINTGHGGEMEYYDFLKILGIESLGISLRKIIDEFVEE